MSNILLLLQTCILFGKNYAKVKTGCFTVPFLI